VTPLSLLYCQSVSHTSMHLCLLRLGLFCCIVVGMTNQYIILTYGLQSSSSSSSICNE
jgi:hypothetical protein